MCSSLDGSHSRAATSTAAIFSQATRSLPAGSSCSHSCAKPVPRHNASAKYTSPNCRERSDADALQTHRHRQGLAAVVKQPGLLGSTDQAACQRPRHQPTALIEFAELRYRLLNDPPPDADAAHQTPVTMDLAVFLAGRVAQIHCTRSQPTSPQKKTPKVGTTCPNRSSSLLKSL